jgi:type IV secretion system protein VirB8
MTPSKDPSAFESGATLPGVAPAYDWFSDRYQSVHVSRNRWFVMAVSLAVVTALQGLALLFLTPLKTTVPFLVREESSGSVTTVEPLNGKAAVTFDEAVRKYFVAKYLECREVYDPTDLLEHYRAVDLMSESAERRSFHQSIVTSNPASPLSLYGNQALRLVTIKSISFLGEGSVQVRFGAVVRRAASPDKTSEWIATLAFRFAAPPSAEADRLVNPLGFEVTSYRVDQEVVP